MISYFTESLQNDNFFKKKKEFEQELTSLYSSENIEDYEKNLFFMVRENEHLKKITYRLDKLESIETNDISNANLNFFITEIKEKSFFMNSIVYLIKTTPMNWQVKRSLQDFIKMSQLLNKKFPF